MTVAIKEVEKSKINSAFGHDRIVTEIQILKVLQHPNIVQMKDFLWNERSIYIVMEYCDGGDLSHYIQEKRKLSESVCQKFMQQMSLGLQYLHSKNISHFDLKPQNLLLVKHPKLTLKIGDFGCAHFLPSGMCLNSTMGSPLFMAPEIHLKKDYDGRADLWSVGIILFMCLFGKAPIPNLSCQAITNHMKAAIPIEIPQSISPDCYDLLKRLLVYDREERITFEQYFDHPFLDLKHYPTEDSYKTAVKIVYEAVKLDNEKKYVDALNTYCEALRYLVPYVSRLPEGLKKESLRAKVTEYTERAEKIKTVLHQTPTSLKAPPGLPLSVSDAANADYSLGASSHSRAQSKPSFEEQNTPPQSLVSMCLNTPRLCDAVEIGNTGQLYLAEGDYKIALEKLESALGIVIPLLEKEPEGQRKVLLMEQVRKWLKLMESIKTFISLQKSTEKQKEEPCEIQ